MPRLSDFYAWLLLCLVAPAHSMVAADSHAAVIREAAAAIVGLQQQPDATPSSVSILSSDESISAFLDAHDHFLFDCDGVLWRGDDGLLPGTIEALQLLERLGKSCVFVTNNAAKSRAAYARRFAALGLGGVSVEQLVPSSFVAARWLQRVAPSSSAFVIGTEGLVEECRDAGITTLTVADFDFPGSDPATNEAAASLAALGEAAGRYPDVGAVVVGHDTQFNFKSLVLASLFLERPNVRFVATNPDAYDMVGKHRMPGNGCFVAAVSTVAGRPPDAVCGKPAPDLARALVDTYQLDPARTCMVGDRLDTDIALGHAMGCSSLLVLTGVATADAVSIWQL